MLENMFIGNPPGNYDRLLDFSRRFSVLIGQASDTDNDTGMLTLL